MFVLTQKEDKLVKIESVYLLSNAQTGKHCVRSVWADTCDTEDLGVYPTREIAQQQLNGIFSAIAQGTPVYKMAKE